MLFHSYTFLIFFCAVVILHRLAPIPARRWILLVASYLFYSSWNARYALLIAASTLVDYLAAGWIEKAETQARRKFFLILSLSTNLGILAVFKYYNFFSHSLTEYLGLHLPIHELLLPVGISFYTFQSMSYTIDVYRRKTGTARDFVDFALFVSFFPQLVAGPIVRAVDFLPQLSENTPRRPEEIRLGLKLFFVGLFKKLVLADNLARVVDQVHANPDAFSSGDLWVSAYAFAFQIYFDFSGYSEMAIGLAQILGYRFPDNFRRPYCAVNMSDFWRRWHISLSTWLRDYLYIPLGGSRNGRSKTLRNLMITMVLGGLWHGANWTFIVWGFLHGLFLIVHRQFQRLRAAVPTVDRLSASPLALPVFVLLTFHCWTLSMVFFRAASLEVALAMLQQMFAFGGGDLAEAKMLLFCGLLYLIQISQEKYDLVQHFDELPLPVRVAIIAIGFWIMVLFTPNDLEPFLYFQF